MTLNTVRSFPSRRALRRDHRRHKQYLPTEFNWRLVLVLFAVILFWLLVGPTLRYVRTSAEVVITAVALSPAVRQGTQWFDGRMQPL